MDITQNKMVRNYSTDNATLSFMQIKHSLVSKNRKNTCIIIK